MRLSMLDASLDRLVPLVVAGLPRHGEVPRDTPAPGGRVLVLSATVGQGHEGAARELGRRLRARGMQVEVRDYLDALPRAARGVLRDLYQPTVPAKNAEAVLRTSFVTPGAR